MPTSFCKPKPILANFPLCSLSNIHRHFKKLLVFTACRDGQVVLIKFVQRYGEAVHRRWADAGLAPKLLACDALPGGWLMVAMELLPLDRWQCLCCVPVAVKHVARSAAVGKSVLCWNDVGWQGHIGNLGAWKALNPSKRETQVGGCTCTRWAVRCFAPALSRFHASRGHPHEAFATDIPGPKPQ